MRAQEYIQIFCQNISRRRQQTGMSFTELSRCSGLPVEMLQQLDQGIMPEEMMADDAIRLAKVFGCKIDELSIYAAAFLFVNIRIILIDVQWAKYYLPLFIHFILL